MFDSGHCAVCQGMTYCTAMNGKLFFDPVIGYTRLKFCCGCRSSKKSHRDESMQLEKQGACEDLDRKTSELSQFGNQYQFKDTPRCHELVWNYHCLSWVTIGAADAPIPLPPCRSLCVEVADRCVYSHFYRTYLENVCGNIPCVREDVEKATANSTDPKKQAPCIKGTWETISSNFSRCSIREYEVPPAHASTTFASVELIIVNIVAVRWLW
ncbi:TPA: hypothetical protein N0F65_003421 [Lagenidium giganteum]|uniref:Uncharacterized protein n=1 Tax=Lagenidium giganteum TaxID=4803 RepID=A0AAV2YIT6_9STRA|nr:TPA: hypothetical protein N0F65_003421 [Lagenidium giganteum]